MFSEYQGLTIDQIIDKELEKNTFTRNDFSQDELHFLGKEIEVWRNADDNLEGKLGELEIITFHKMFLKIILSTGPKPLPHQLTMDRWTRLEWLTYTTR